MEKSAIKFDEAKNFTDEQLILVGKGEESNSVCIDILIQRYMRVVAMKAAKMKTKCNMEYDDLISEGLLGLLNAIRCFDIEKCSSDGKFKAFAGTCIANKMKTAAIGTKQTVSVDYDFDFEQIEDEQASAEDLIIDREENGELVAKIKNILTKTEYAVMELYLKKLSYAKMAEKLGVSEKAVDNALRRAKGKLRDYFRMKQ